MSDEQTLAAYIETWRLAVRDFLAVATELADDEWALPTDLPGWDVKAVVSHVAHLESILAGGPEETADIGEPAHVTGPMGQFTEIGVVTRRDRSPASIIEEIRSATETRSKQLQADPPTDASAPAPGIFGLIGWTQRTLLRNRPLDVWMHEQDVRRAVGRPGGMDSAAAQHVADYLSEAFPFIVGKKVKPPVGTTAVLAVEGSPEVAVVIGEDGRGQRLLEVPADPDVRVALDRATFTAAAGGRRTPGDGSVAVTGDAGLGQRIVDHLATTP
ncbi:uncharacterized protein (TIGR03083 family) [Nocardioides thalensis]|uniref:Uncharacterized protein (TIGR03083 family) n=1 Tax=Nocardioides thalensis TaxID=1914755 RepID=A0A853C5K8_9ACTN|nr:maleylpyruvate isomerase family mycothiol-dependent enzyme [Nocardioides thalensis]NYJ03085.1 uncharacterized protein (TIGR03083 family) [Nocardioides thalensis]